MIDIGQMWEIEGVLFEVAEIEDFLPFGGEGGKIEVAFLKQGNMIRVYSFSDLLLKQSNGDAKPLTE